MPAPHALTAKDRPVWALFDDWCAAADLTALPADPVTLAEFIAENPAALATQRRRVTVINSVHRTAGHLAPGTADAVRRLLNRARAARLSAMADTVSAIIDTLPLHGWPTGLFGRRDALLLLLSASGLTFEQISNLRRRDLAVDGEDLIITTGHPTRLEPRAHPETRSPAQVYTHWLQVLEFQDRAPSTQLLADRLEAGTLPTRYAPRPVPEQVLERRQRAPLFTPVDRWGHTPLIHEPLSAPSISTIVTAYVSGRPTPHPPYRRRPQAPARPEPEPEVYPEVVLDNRRHAQNLQARHAAHQALADVPDILDDVEKRADAILEQLLAVLGSES